MEPEDPEVLRDDVVLVEATLERLPGPLEQARADAVRAFELQLMLGVIGDYLDSYGDDRSLLVVGEIDLGESGMAAVSITSADPHDLRTGHIVGESESVSVRLPEPLHGYGVLPEFHYFLNGTLDDPEEWAYRCGVYRRYTDVVASALRGDVATESFGRARRRTKTIVRTRYHGAFTVSRGRFGFVSYSG